MSTFTFSKNHHSSSSDKLVSLYNKIPDYDEIKHLKESEFIQAIEGLKEQFRRCRATLYKDNPNNNSSLSSSSSESEGEDGHKWKDPRSIKNVNITNKYASSSPLSPRRDKYDTEPSLQVRGYQTRIHSPSPFHHLDKPLKRSLSFQFHHTNNKVEQNHEDEDDGILSLSGDSDWSQLSLSTPDLKVRRRRSDYDYKPPQNVEKRLLERKICNSSAPSLSRGSENDLERQNETRNHHPVPEHVYKPLYDFIMLKNQRRSQKVRDQSKKKLMAQVKPFSFTQKENKSGNNHDKPPMMKPPPDKEVATVLNNTRTVRNTANRSCNHHNNTGWRTVNHFKANPPPPRSRVLLSALKQKEQQEYRELKKRLRADALLKSATLPPSMAARDKSVKLSNAKLEAILTEFQNSCNSEREKEIMIRMRRHSGTPGESVLSFDDKEELELSFKYLEDSNGKIETPHDPSTTGSPAIHARRKPRNFTPYGRSRHSSAALGLFECTVNDNLASRLRMEATKKKEAERVKREEEELLKIMRNESRRKKLKDSHLSAWRRALSYSSTQDIAMRRQLRAAAAILERESFVRDMSTMLSRVRSAPLLLEGVRERRFEPCKKHKEEFRHLLTSSDYGYRSLSNNNRRMMDTSKFTRNVDWFLKGRRTNTEDDDEDDQALAEGSLTSNSEHDEDDNDKSICKDEHRNEDDKILHDDQDQGLSN